MGTGPRTNSGDRADSNAPVTRKLDTEEARALDLQKITLDEKSFRYQLNDDAMGTEKLAEGIRLFCADAVKLEKMIDALR